jgi:protein-L-isoaspartate(D-aspartate) O-methyltransferase
MPSIEVFRAFYAHLVTASVGVTDARIREAFAAVPRERFLGPGPWQVLVEDGYITTPTADPALVYQDIVVSLAIDKGINNGEPSLHARILDAVRPQPGERVLQIGCGSGYYTALLAELVGPSGRVTALDIEATLADRAKANLADRPNVVVECRSGTLAPLPQADVIYVSAGATEPLKVWRDALSPKGRLIFPLTPGRGYGAMLRVTRSDAADVFAARLVTRACFIACVGGQSEAAVEGLRKAYAGGGWQDVRSLHCGTPPDASCWYAGEGWWLSRREA